MLPEEFTRFADVLPEPMLLVAGDGVIIAVNRGAARHLMRPAGKFVGCRLADIVTEPPKAIDRYLRASSRSRQPVLFSLTLVSADGEQKAYRAEGAAVRPKSDAEPVLILLRLVAKEQTASSVNRLNQRDDELRRAANAHSRLEERYHAFISDMLFSVTEGKLVLCRTVAELPKPTARFGMVSINGPEHIKNARHLACKAADFLNFADSKAQDLATAVSEAAMNAYSHAQGGSATLYTSEGALQVWIEDHGRGIAMENLPRATLQRGFTTAGTLGHGFKLILQTADRVWLCTGDRGTTLVIGQTATVSAAPGDLVATGLWP